jgi:hypothetical protein
MKKPDAQKTINNLVKSINESFVGHKFKPYITVKFIIDDVYLTRTSTILDSLIEMETIYGQNAVRELTSCIVNEITQELSLMKKNKLI